MITWAQGALDFFKGYHKGNAEFIDNFSYFDSNHLSLVRKDGALDLYHGVIRAVDAQGNRILDDVDYQDYNKYIEEEVRNWSYMKFPYLKHLGKEKGWYRVGPLARLNTCDFIPSPLAQKEFEEYKAYTNGKPNNMCMHMHWARLIETLHSAEMMKELLNDPDLQGNDLVTKGEKIKEGVGVIEAPRGTLFHHYKIDDNDQVEMANLIVSTTNNNQPMNNGVNFVANAMMNNQTEITEPMMNAVEVVIRAYDPCLSCATHAMGKMPLEISLFNKDDILIDRKIK
jgi:NAD-reducing hydrogenase large subunit